MKVRIVKCSFPHAWYASNLHYLSEFEAYEKGDEYCFDEGGTTYHILKTDCEVIEQ